MLLWYFFVCVIMIIMKYFPLVSKNVTFVLCRVTFFTNFPRSLPRNNNKRYKKYGKGGMFNHMFKLHLSNKCSFVHLQVTTEQITM